MIDFSKIEETSLQNFYGGEGALIASMFTDDKNRILKGTLVPGATIGLHTHETSSEIIFILSGNGKAVLDGAEEKLKPCDCHYCKKGSQHALVNDGDEDLVFYAVVPQQ